MLSIERQAQHYASHIQRTGKRIVYLWPRTKLMTSRANQARLHLLAALLNTGTRAYGYTQAQRLDQLEQLALKAGYCLKEVDGEGWAVEVEPKTEAA